LPSKKGSSNPSVPKPEIISTGTCSSGTGGDGRYQAARAVDLLTLSLLFTGIQEKRGENPVYLA